MRVWLALRQLRHVAAHRATVPAEFADRIDLADHQKAADYSRAKIRLGIIELAVDAVLLLLFSFGGLLTAFDQFWRGMFADMGYAHGLALFASVGIAGFCISLPFSLYRTFSLEARFGFNKMTPGLYVADLLKQLLLTVLIGAPLLLAVLWLMGAMGERWWLYVWAAWLGFNLLVLLLYPTYIAPLFNKFTPLADGEMKTRIEALLARCGFASSGLFVMDGSKRSAHGNAYFTGFGRAKRIVFFDTLLDKLVPGEVEAVLAHELGHYKHRHVWKRIAVMAALSLALLWLLGQIIDQTWFYDGLKVGVGETAQNAAMSTAMALILFSLVLPVFTFPFAPLMSWLSRRHEFEADAYAAKQASSNELIAALVKLYRDNAATLTPDPLFSLFYDSHPPASQRIAHLRSVTS
ncbi:MAG: M48 family metallopeptidase [Gammaproteobacteria bacterium]|nr:M48 family metallopeptidase [Rhodocyclaceae bacterium]MBU3910022.1 M48 family metallopeptidase [Gammaproteobacteria bacterium]MBU3989896.1 M48 family metallopeptidase [Gammaproteobacteria bacterium]MBU4003995.1 M48 family metallopeptidase [Gammaproteobacteria bacterium]MBU4020242.1 M48 family metallopeptidase [Gammaproteobacteria bacterium]